MQEVTQLFDCDFPTKSRFHGFDLVYLHYIHVHMSIYLVKYDILNEVLARPLRLVLYEFCMRQIIAALEFFRDSTGI